MPKFEYRLIPKHDSWLMCAVGAVIPGFMDYWTTYRVPGRIGVITYPSHIKDPRKHPKILEHERVHVEQQRTAWGLFKSFWLVWLLPLPVLFSGRWFIERPAYLLDIRNGRHSLESAVSVLWGGYFYPWPRKLMRQWFIEQLRRDT